MPFHTLKVTGVSEELLRLLDDQIRARHVSGRSEYIRELIRRDVLPIGANGTNTAACSFRDLLDPVAQEVRHLGEVEDETEAFIHAEIKANRRERHARSLSEVP